MTKTERGQDLVVMRICGDVGVPPMHCEDIRDGSEDVPGYLVRRIEHTPLMHSSFTVIMCSGKGVK